MDKFEFVMELLATAQQEAENQRDSYDPKHLVSTRDAYESIAMILHQIEKSAKQYEQLNQ